jgi:hypothetical protein
LRKGEWLTATKRQARGRVIITRWARELAEVLARTAPGKTRVIEFGRFAPIVTSWREELLAFATKHGDGEGELLFTPWKQVVNLDHP